MRSLVVANKARPAAVQLFTRRDCHVHSHPRPNESHWLAPQSAVALHEKRQNWPSWARAYLSTFLPGGDHTDRFMRFVPSYDCLAVNEVGARWPQSSRM